jgi:hypothetical protein
MHFIKNDGVTPAIRLDEEGVVWGIKYLFAGKFLLEE